MVYFTSYMLGGSVASKKDLQSTEQVEGVFIECMINKWKYLSMQMAIGVFYNIQHLNDHSHTSKTWAIKHKTMNNS